MNRIPFAAFAQSAIAPHSSSPFPIRWAIPPVDWRRGLSLLLSVVLVLLTWVSSPLAAQAGLTDDRYDGNIFPLYAGTGSLVPPRVKLSESLQRDNPTLLVFYADDSRDCKEYASVISQLDAFYGRAADFIPISIDAIPVKESYQPSDPGYYYSGLVPQVILLDQAGNVVLNETGQVPFERIDDQFRQVFDLLPRSESVELKRRQANEINVELQVQ